MIRKPLVSEKIIPFKGTGEMESAYKVCKRLLKSWGYLSGNITPVFLASISESPSDDYDDIAELYMGVYSLGTVNIRDGEDKDFENLLSIINKSGYDWSYIVFSGGAGWPKERQSIDDIILLHGSDIDIFGYCANHVTAHLALANTREIVSMSAIGTRDASALVKKYLSRYASSNRIVSILNSIPGMFIKFKSIADEDEYHRILNGIDKDGNQFLLRIDY